MPQKIADILNNASEEDRKEILDEQAEKVFKRDQKKTKKTLSAQRTHLDRIYAGIYYAIKNDAVNMASELPLEQQYELGTSGDGFVPQDANDAQDEYASETVSAIVKPPKFDEKSNTFKFDLDEVKEFYTLLAMVKAKSNYELGLEREENKKLVPEGLDPDTAEKLTDYLTLTSNSIPHKTSYYADSLITNLLDKSAENENMVQSYREILQNQLRSEGSKVFEKNPDITFAQFMDLTHMTEKDRATMLKMYKCKAEDKMFPVFEKNADEHLQGRKRADLQGERLIARENDVRAKARSLFNESYKDFMLKGWLNIGAEKFEKGLQPSEQKIYRQGLKAGTSKLSSAQEYLSGKNVDYRTPENKLRKENILKNYRTANNIMMSGKPLGMRQSYGLSEAFAAGNDTMAERALVMDGAVKEFESGPSVWKHHSKDSKAYTEMVNSIRNYRNALAAKEGGKAMDIRQTMYRKVMNYVKDKHSLRSEENGRKRFDDAMTVLCAEMKESEFQKLVNKINKSRGKDEKITVEQYTARVQSFRSKSVDDSLLEQNNSYRPATVIPDNYQDAMMEMDRKYAQSMESLVSYGGTNYPPIAIKGTAPGCRLSGRDYSAITYSSSLLSKERDNFLHDEDILYQNDEAVADAKKAANIALDEYGKGNKLPLANILTMGVKNLHEQAQGRTEQEKVCMNEMAGRMLNMLDRDPELKKHAMRSGLQEEDIRKAKEISAPEVKLELRQPTFAQPQLLL